MTRQLADSLDTTVATQGRLSRPAAFWAVAATFTLFLAAASAPTPLYGLYAERWHFGPVALTSAFAVYALALLATLLITGSLSDALGRRPVILASLGVQSVAMVVFLLANGLPELFVARVLQGIATGLVTAAVAAALLDLQPEDRPGRGPLTNAVTPSLGLAVGAVGSGALVQYGPHPLHLVFWVLLAAFVALAAVLTRLPAGGGKGRDAISLRPRVHVEPAARPTYLGVLPGIVAPWALGGLYLSLGPSVVLSLDHSQNRLLGGSFVALLCVVSAVACLVTRNRPAPLQSRTGCALLVVAAVVTVVAVANADVALLFVSTAIAGAGFGLAFLGGFRLIVAGATPEHRGELLAAVYVAAYLAFSVPAVVAGFITPHAGLRDTTIGYTAAAGLLAALALVTTRTRVRSG